MLIYYEPLKRSPPIIMKKSPHCHMGGRPAPPRRSSRSTHQISSYCKRTSRVIFFVRNIVWSQPTHSYNSKHAVSPRAIPRTWSGWSKRQMKTTSRRAFDRADVEDEGAAEDGRGRRRSSMWQRSRLWSPAATRGAGWGSPRRRWGGGRRRQRLRRRSVSRGGAGRGSPRRRLTSA